MLKYKVLRGFDVRLAPGSEEFRRVAEVGDIITAADCPEWGGEAPQCDIDAGVIEVVSEPQEQSPSPSGDPAKAE